METKHTKGEWVNGWGDGITGPTTPNTYNRLGSITVSEKWPSKPVSLNKNTICAVIAQPKKDNRLEPDLESMEANAKLIAAAPDLLEALLKMKPQLNQWIKQEKETIGYMWAEKALNAINKATK